MVLSNGSVNLLQAGWDEHVRSLVVEGGMYVFTFSSTSSVFEGTICSNLNESSPGGCCMKAATTEVNSCCSSQAKWVIGSASAGGSELDPSAR